MENNKKRLFYTLIFVIVAGILLVVSSLYLFSQNEGFRNLFTGGEVLSASASAAGGDAEELLQQRMEFTGKLSMWIFLFITLLQFAAIWVGYAVISTIKYSSDPVKLKLRNLDNAEVFFDVPLYFGLFGTVSAFLVMTFSPQSSRLIAYSSTLIGIIFSLLLRLTLQYPLRKQLVRQDALDEMAEDKE